MVVVVLGEEERRVVRSSSLCGASLLCRPRGGLERRKKTRKKEGSLSGHIVIIAIIPLGCVWQSSGVLATLRCVCCGPRGRPSSAMAMWDDVWLFVCAREPSIHPSMVVSCDMWRDGLLGETRVSARRLCAACVEWRSGEKRCAV